MQIAKHQTEYFAQPKRWTGKAAFWVCLVVLLANSGQVYCQPPEFGYTPTNSSGTFYGQATINGIPASEGDWVGAFDSSGNCAGASQIVLNGGAAYINLPVYGDDATTASVDEGITGSEPFTLQLWQSSQNLVLNYPSSDAIILFEDWANVNGAPMPGYDDPNVIYNFEAETQPPYITGPDLLCESSDPVGFQTFPPGGIITGPGVFDNLFDPSIAGVGTHIIEYSIDTSSATWTIVVQPAFDATILTEGPFCVNDEGIELESSTEGGTWIGSGVFGSTFEPSTVSPGSVLLTYEVGETGDACYDIDQQVITVYPSPSIPLVELIQPLLDGTFHVVTVNQEGVTHEWFDLVGTQLASGDTLFNYNEETFVLVATNEFGCSTSLVTQLVFPGVFDLRDVPYQWVDLNTLEFYQGVESVALYDILGKKLWSEQVHGSRRIELPMTSGDGFRLIITEFSIGGNARLTVIR